LTSPRQPAIKFDSVSKIYKLYGSQRDQLVDVLGLQRFGFRPRREPKIFPALSDISIEVPRGHRIGIIGRNGAGKTTLLKLVCGNFSPTFGSVSVNGGVQALMSAGLGFHPDHTGRENVEASLQYNGLRKSEYEEAVKGIIDFCELGEFFDQPLKTYSLGMQARLMFAAATAIRPDILIVDEILGAGDAYFIAKSKNRVEALVRSGCTMLLVSHSMPQVLELCSEVIWLHEGKIRMRGDALVIVKAYEEYLHGPINQISKPQSGFESESELQTSDTTNLPVTARWTGEIESRSAFTNGNNGVLLQEPRWVPHGEAPQLPAVIPPRDFKFVARGGLSRWGSGGALQICGFTILTPRGETNKVTALMPVRFVVNLVAELDGNFACRYGVAVFDHLGSCRGRIVSPIDTFTLLRHETHCAAMTLNPLQFGPGEYVLSLSIHDGDRLENFGNERRFDLLGRSFEMTVELPDSLASFSADFFHSAEWQFDGLAGVSEDEASLQGANGDG
jgi:lipopolysaccharide transport system ATP-binding protein